MEEVFWQAAGSIVDLATPHGQAALWCGLELCAIDGFQIDVPATGANREEFGSSGTSDGSGPFPQARAVLVTARAARAMLAPAMDARGRRAVRAPAVPRGGGRGGVPAAVGRVGAPHGGEQAQGDGRRAVRRPGPGLG